MNFLIRFNGHPVRFLPGSTTVHKYIVVREDEADFFPTEAAARERMRVARMKPAALVDVFPVSPKAELARFRRAHTPMRPAYTGD